MDHPPDRSNPWRKRSGRLVYENDWIQVEEDQVLTPAGDPGIYGVVRPRHLALGIVPLDDDRHTWLVGQYRYTLDTYSWEIPEGGGNPDLDPAAEAARELAEETGLTATRWDLLLELHTSNCFTDERALIYLARGLKLGAPRPDETEQLAIHRLPLSEAVNWVRKGRITDALSVAALLRAADRGLA